MVVAISSQDALREIKPDLTRVSLLRVSTRAAECRSTMLPLFPRSFSTVSGWDRGTLAVTVPPRQISHPVAATPSGESPEPSDSALAKKLSQSEAYAENLAQAKPTPVAMLPAPSSCIMRIKSLAPEP